MERSFPQTSVGFAFHSSDCLVSPRIRVCVDEVNIDADDLDLIRCMDLTCCMNRSALGQVIDKKDPSILQAMAFLI